MALSYIWYILRNGLGQQFFVPPAPLTEKNLPDQTNRVFMITGGYAGVGQEVASILYGANGTVWIVGRSESKASAAIDRITAQHPQSLGKLHFLKVDLSDLTTINPAVEEFHRRNESGKLHWLNNNAGVMTPPPNSTGAQGLDLQYVTNIYAPFLLTKLLLPTLRETAKTEKSAPGTVRVSWAGSSASFMSRPHAGLAWTPDNKDLVYAIDNPQMAYAISKAANFYLGTEFGHRFGDDDGVLHDSYNPGNLRSELQRHLSGLPQRIIYALVHPPIQGAYTELYCGLSPELTLPNDQGAWVVPWGRKSDMRPDMLAEAKRAGEKDSVGSKLWEWCESVTREYA